MEALQRIVLAFSAYAQTRTGSAVVLASVVVLLILPGLFHINSHTPDADVLWFLHIAAITFSGARWRVRGVIFGMLASLSIYAVCEIWPLPALVDTDMVPISDRLSVIALIAGVSAGLGSLAGALSMAEHSHRQMAAALAAEQAVRAALADAEQRHRSLIETLPAAAYIVMTDDTFNTPYVSPQIEQMLGITPEAWAALNEDEWYAHVHPDDVAGVHRVYDNMDAQTDRVIYDYRFRHADGRWVWMRDEMVLVRGTDGAPSYWQGLIVDISAERQAAEHLRAVERRNRTLVNNLPAVVYINEVHDLYSNTYVSTQMQHLLGIDPKAWTDLSHEEWLDGVHPDDRARVSAEHHHCDQTGETLDTIYRYRRSDGAYVWLHDIMVLVRGESSEPDYWQGVLVDITAQRTAAEELQASEERFRGIFEEAPIPMAIADLHGRMLRINDAYTALLGYSLDDFDHTPIDSIIHPDDRAEAEENRALFASGRRDAYSSQRRYIASDGRIVSTIVNLSLMRDRDRRPAFIVSHIQDITASRAREEALRESEARFRNLFESAPIAMAIGDLEGRFIRVNAAHCALFGYTPEEILGQPIDILTHPEDRDEARINRARVHAGEPFNQSSMRRYRAKDGSTIWGLLSLSMLHDSDGNPANMVAQIQDITEIRTAEVRVRDSEARFRGAFDYSPVGITLSTPEGHYHRVNRAFCAMLGYTEQEVLGMHFIDLTHPDDVAENVEERRLLIDGHIDHFAIEKRYIHRNGHEVWAILNTSIVRDEDGKPQFVVGQAQNISDRKALEQRLQHQAFHDSLTGLPNRSLFLDRLDHALARSARNGEQLAVLYLDLDGFKAVNDSLGHAAGDELLAIFARRLRSWVRADDTVARLGGDEFTVLLESLTSRQEALDIAQRIVDGTSMPYVLYGKQMHVRVSVGVAYTHGGGERPQTLLHYADLALYHAKTTARTTVVDYNPSMQNTEITHLPVNNSSNGTSMSQILASTGS